MARQRFIWPDIWEDPVFGRLQPLEQVLFIGLFSNADDDGRLLADPAHLKAQVFRYTDFTNARVRKIRDDLARKMASVCLYTVDGQELIALLKWTEYQKPKYPKASKFPAPPIPEVFPEASPNLPEGFPSSGSSGDLRVGLDRDGLDRALSATLPPSAEKPSIFAIPDLREEAS